MYIHVLYMTEWGLIWSVDVLIDVEATGNTVLISVLTAVFV